MRQALTAASTGIAHDALHRCIIRTGYRAVCLSRNQPSAMLKRSGLQRRCTAAAVAASNHLAATAARPVKHPSSSSTAARPVKHAPGKCLVPVKAAASRVLFVGGLPAFVSAGELQQQLLDICTAAGLQSSRAQAGLIARAMSKAAVIHVIWLNMP